VIRVTVKLFAILRDCAGVSSLTLELPEGSTIEFAISLLLVQHPALARPLARSAFAVNRGYAARDAVLRDDDELALIPPVSGGAGA
jgi:molybdopterin converting factor subunit 1